MSQRGTSTSSAGNPQNNAAAQAQGEPKSVRDAYDAQQEAQQKKGGK